MTTVTALSTSSLSLKTKVESINNPKNLILKRLKDFANQCASDTTYSYSRMHNRHNRS